MLQVGTTSQTVTPSLQPTPSDTTNLANRTGHCDVTVPMPTSSGSYVCTVTVRPGGTQQSSDSRQIGRSWFLLTGNCDGDSGGDEVAVLMVVIVAMK